MDAVDRKILAELQQHGRLTVTELAERVRLSGDPDYLLRVIAADLPAFQRLYDDVIAALPGVQRLSSTLVMKSVVDNRPLPL